MEAILLVAIVAIAAAVVIVKNKNKSTDSDAADTRSTVKAVAAVATAQSAPAIQAGIDEETVAAIMAAISCLTDTATGTTYAARSINRAKSDRPAWCFAGMQQNTRPF